MTAEVAILNKTAVALAADSAVTISAGSSQEEIYDTADKLFELSCADPIAIMINSDMNFMETPLPVLIKDYRQSCPNFIRVEDAAADFLRYLHRFGCEAPERVKLQRLRLAVIPIIELIQRRTSEALLSRLSLETAKQRPFSEVINELVGEQIAVVRTALEKAPPAALIGGKAFKLSKAENEAIREEVYNRLQMADNSQRDDVVTMVRSNLHKRGLTDSNTGIVVAGFGSDELFPTLISMQLEGMFAGRLKYKQTDTVDIDRNGERARVLPFAQREMVERFLYGLDSGIERQVTNFCKSSVPRIREEILGSLDIADEDRSLLIGNAQKAEQVFFTALAEDSFEVIRQQSRSEIEDMVEFMPKPEMAKMAEALVNLTSIKRRVSRGMETVGGAIDVAVVSRSEGFVWVKRKHYFPEELNRRFFDRMARSSGHTRRRHDHEQALQPRDAGAGEDGPKVGRKVRRSGGRTAGRSSRNAG